MWVLTLGEPCFFRIRQENDMVDSAPQWEAVLRRQKEKNQADPNNRRSRHRSRSYVLPLYAWIEKLRTFGSMWILGHIGLSLLRSSKVVQVYHDHASICLPYLFCFIVTLINYIWRGGSWSRAKAKCHKHKAITIMFYFVFKQKCIFSWISRKPPLFWSQTVEIPAASLLWSLGPGWTSYD